MPIAPEILFEEMEIDPETGFPFLPDNLAWKVRAVDGHRDLVAVGIVSKTRRLTSRVKDVRMEWEDFGILEEYSEPTGEGMTAAAKKIYERTKEIQDNSRKINSVVGIYEPKR